MGFHQVGKLQVFLKYVFASNFNPGTMSMCLRLTDQMPSGVVQQGNSSKSQAAPQNDEKGNLKTIIVIYFQFDTIHSTIP